MLAWVEHSGHNLVEGPVQNPLPFIQERGGVEVRRPHPRDVSPGNLDYLSAVLQNCATIRESASTEASVGVAVGGSPYSLPLEELQ